MSDPVSAVVAVLICIPAVLLALRQSSFLLDYLFFVVALNRGIRRFFDYQNGEFNPYSFISLTPIIVCGLATLVVLIELNQRGGRFGTRTLNILYVYGTAVAFAFVIGFINAKFAAIYALGDYIAPIGLIGFASLWCNKEGVIERWCNSFAISALLVGSYGIWQYYTIPPWDAFWLVESGLDGYMGQPEPTKMTLFSTMHERGPTSTYLCSGLMLLLLRPGTLGVLRWPAIAIIGYAMLLTYVRTNIVFAVLAVLLFPLINRGSGLVPIMGLLLSGIIAGPAISKLLPERVKNRVSTLGDVSNDGSFQGRLIILQGALAASATEPLGLGIGSYGLAARVSTANAAVGGDSTGYIQTLRIFGWLGFVAITWMLWTIWKTSSELLRLEMDDDLTRLYRAWFLAGLVAFLSGNWLFGASFFWVLAGHVLGRYDQISNGILDDVYEEQLDTEELDDQDDVYPAFVR